MRFAVFFTVVLAIWALMHSYVLWRLASVPLLAGKWGLRYWCLLGFVLWASYPLVRILETRGWDWVALPLAYLASTWIGVLFLLLAGMLVVDVLTLGGWLFSDTVPKLRGYAALACLALSALALVQGLRPPVVRQLDLEIRDLPHERNGTRLVMLSDLHLGTLIRGNWLAARVQQVRDLRPDVICLVGDVIDGDNDRVRPMVPVLRQFQAPLGTWVVTGNHEFYAGLEGSLQLFQQAGFNVLRDSAQEIAPGLTLAGVDDLTARSQLGQKSDALPAALDQLAPGATILLSHTPSQAQEAARHGVDLMLCGHTHNGQIWPFNYLVQLRYPIITGQRQVEGMRMIVGRGTGTWGPRMRLWHPSEILLIRLLTPAGPKKT